MAHKTPRKTVSVTFAGDDDVVHHVINVHARDKQNNGTRKTTRSRKKSEDFDDLSDEESSDAEVFQIPTALEANERDLVGSDVFAFHTPKRGSRRSVKVSEVKTPKSALKNASSKSNKVSDEVPELKTPKSALKTPKSSKTSRSAAVDEKNTPRKSSHNIHKKVEATTPFRLRRRNIENLDEDDSSDSSGTSSSDDSDKDDTNETAPKQTPSRKRRNIETGDQHNMAEEYFTVHSGSAGLTSDRTLARLGIPKMEEGALNEMLRDVPSSHIKECSLLYEDHRALFNKWMLQMCNGFNLLLFGLGSKRSLLEDFRNTMIKDFKHLVVNGYFPSLTIKHILSAILDDLLDDERSFRNPIDQLSCIKETQESKIYEDIYVIIHNIDGAMLRSEKTQTILSLLSQVRGMHVIASIDHINATLIWDQSKSSCFNWLWYDCTTYMTYSEETSYENSLLVQQSGVLALSSLTHVMKSLTPNARGVYVVLVRYQMDNSDISNYNGMSFQDLYQRCRELFLVNSDLTLRAQLTEFKDHKLLRSKKGYDGIELLHIPLDSATLSEFLEQQDDT